MTSVPGFPPAIHVSFRNMEPSPAATARIETGFAKLLRRCPEITSARAVVETLHRHHQPGHHFQVHLDIRMPGGEIVVSHEPSGHRASAAATHPAKATEQAATHRDAYVAINDAFDIVHRQVRETARQARPQRQTAG